MAISGAWKNASKFDAGAEVWGTGVNPVHNTRDMDGRNIAPGASLLNVPEHVTDPNDVNDWQSDEWSADFVDDGIGTNGYPAWNDDTELIRADAGSQPSWGNYENGVPGGTAIRQVSHGARRGDEVKQIPSEDAGTGWLNKVTSFVGRSRPSSTRQLLIQTSQLQVDSERTGSQRGDGSASEYSAPIKTIIPGMKLKVYAGGPRHEDMFPRQQFESIRPFWSRQAGTGYVEWLEPNAAYESYPLQRNPPADPFQGPNVPEDINNSSDYGYTDGDYYA